MERDWFSIGYLQHGSPSQQLAFHILQELKVMEILAPFQPVLTGTFPLDLAVPTSDLDICCQSPALPLLTSTCQKAFYRYEGFSVREKVLSGIPSLLVRFYYREKMIEIFGQAVPVREQLAFRHMLAEHHFLQKWGEPLRQQVLSLKMAGIKTEPAFAQALELKGNPYESLLRFCP